MTYAAMTHQVKAILCRYLIIVLDCSITTEGLHSTEGVIRDLILFNKKIYIERISKYIKDLSDGGDAVMHEQIYITEDIVI